MRNVLGKTGWALCVLAVVGWMAWGMSLGFAAWPDSTPSYYTIRGSTALIDQANPTTATVDAATMSLQGNVSNAGRYGIIKFDVSGVPGDDAIYQAHVTVAAQKNVAFRYMIREVNLEPDITATTWVEYKSGTAWGQAGANSVGGVSYTLADSVASDDSSDYRFLDYDGTASAWTANEIKRADVTGVIARARHAGRDWVAFIMQPVDTVGATDTGQFHAGGAATAAYKPSLYIQSGQNASAGGGGGTGVVGNGDRGIQ